MYPDELKIFQAIGNKYKLMTISDYAKHIGKAYNTIIDVVKRGSVMYAVFNNRTYILSV